MPVRYRRMKLTDIDAGMNLKQIVGWNQTHLDWQRFLTADPAGSFVAEHQNQIVGTVTSISYQDKFAWIGMMIVHPDFRSRGIGRALMQQALEYLEKRGHCCLRLDATPQGQPLYESLDFEVEYSLQRWVLERPANPDQFEVPVPSVNLNEISSLDRKIFGADRAELIASVAAECPGSITLAGQGGKQSAYALARRGTISDHIGPWVACDQAAGEKVLDEILQRSGRGRVIVDSPVANSWAAQILEDKGFVVVRQLARMFRGKLSHPGQPGYIGAILGPEFG